MDNQLTTEEELFLFAEWLLKNNFRKYYSDGVTGWIKDRSGVTFYRTNQLIHLFKKSLIPKEQISPTNPST